MHPPSKIKLDLKFKTLRWRLLRWRLTLSESGAHKHCFGQTGPFHASHAPAVVAIFVIFFVFRSLRCKPLVFVDRMYIRHFRHFRPNPLFLEGAKTLCQNLIRVFPNKQKISRDCPGIWGGGFCCCVLCPPQGMIRPKHINIFLTPTQSRGNTPNLFMFMFMFCFPLAFRIFDGSYYKVRAKPSGQILSMFLLFWGCGF